MGLFLKNQGYSRHILTHLKQTDRGICIDDIPVFTSQMLKAGTMLTIRIIEKEASEHIQPVKLPFSIVYEDEDIMVVNKPADMAVHPSHGNYSSTLANGVAWYFHQQNVPYVFRCINRIDRDTSGLLILAKHMLSGAILSKAMKERRIHRTYLAIVQGCPFPKTGTVSAPIGRSPHSILERRVDAAGDPAITHYRVLSFSDRAALVKLQLDTGRTHQIRVHMKYIGHPLLGDFLYHPENNDFPRQALHSYSLAFSHPITGESMFFQCPPADDMEKFLQTNHISCNGDSLSLPVKPL